MPLLHNARPLITWVRPSGKLTHLWVLRKPHRSRENTVVKITLESLLEKSWNRMNICWTRMRLGYGEWKTKLTFESVLATEFLLKSRGLNRPQKIRVTRNLVDPASSHMLVSRIKPCKSQSKWINSGSANGSLNQLQSTRERSLTAPVG